ncbi:HMG domain-containing protein 4 isoform X1 [Python bivittatus]|uniref:High mobility group protein 2-like 1 n=2 Tax=Python bivittatus TaxID=176946 RepID=A0A9F5IVA3_PYTBI|nr:HMG domain-containing protein 4 isoform X1 [Python bivittatus]
MAYDDSKKKEDSDQIDDVGLAAGRAQREKKRSYKDLLREEEEIAAQVRKNAKNRLKDSNVFLLGTESDKKRKHSSSKHCYRDFCPFELSLPLETSSKSRNKVILSPLSADTAMDLLKAISTPLATGSKSSKRTLEKSSHSSFSAPGYSEGKKEHHKKKLSGSSDPPLDDGTFHKSKKIKPPYVNTEMLTLREPDGLKMKLILSPKEKGGSITDDPFPHSGATKKASKKSIRDEQSSLLPSHDTHAFLKSSRKKHKPPSDPHPLPAAEGFSPDTSLFPEGQSSDFELSSLEPQMESGSSSGGELEAGELVIDDSYREIKKKKKSKKSKKKKDKEKHKEKKHSKLKKSAGLSSSPAAAEITQLPVSPTNIQFAVPAPPPPPPPPPVFYTDGQNEKKKKKEEKDKIEKIEKDKPKKKNMSAYQVFCKEYRVNIVAEHPGIDFGELSKKLAEVWKQLPEKDKLVWKQKAQYLQHKQNKAEATTVKRKATSSEGAPKLKASLTSVPSPHKKSPTSTVVLSSSPVKVPETDPIDVAAHLQLLGESLSLIGHRLQETEGMVAVSGSLSVLLDSIICALGPLTCLTSQLPELNGCPKHVLSNTLDNIAYIMPGL